MRKNTANPKSARPAAFTPYFTFQSITKALFLQIRQAQKAQLLPSATRIQLLPASWTVRQASHPRRATFPPALLTSAFIRRVSSESLIQRSGTARRTRCAKHVRAGSQWDCSRIWRDLTHIHSFFVVPRAHLLRS